LRLGAAGNVAVHPNKAAHRVQGFLHDAIGPVPFILFALECLGQPVVMPQAAQE
jgi:hypothetical protein